MAELDTSSGGGKKGKKHGSKKMSTRIDLTPMVDLGFLLVTFFMLTTTFSKPQTMEINMPVKDKTDPQEQGQDVKASKAMTIILGKEDKVFYYFGIQDPEVLTTGYDDQGIRKILIEKNREIRDMVCVIKPTDECNYKNFVDILDEMNIVGIKRYAVVDMTDLDRDLIKDK